MLFSSQLLIFEIQQKPDSKAKDHSCLFLKQRKKQTEKEEEQEEKEKKEEEQEEEEEKTRRKRATIQSQPLIPSHFRLFDF